MIAPLTVDSLGAAIAARRKPADVRGRVVGRRIELHAAIDSTNDRARELAASGEPEGTVVVAEEQRRGRGRSNRSWHSAPGVGLYMSALLRPVASPPRAQVFGLLAAVGAATALGRLSPGKLWIKWPNDLVAEAPGVQGRRKLAGILTEARTAPDRIRDLVIGIGVNVNHERGDFPDEIVARATSLRMLLGHPVDRADVAAEILTAIDDWYTLWRREGERPVIEAFRALAPDVEGRQVLVTGGAAPWKGTTAGLTDDGALRVLPDGGTGVVEVRYGEVLRVEEA